MEAQTPGGDLEVGGVDPIVAGPRVRVCRDPVQLERFAFENLVRTALACCVEGMSGYHFQRAVSRIQLAGGVVGDRFHTRDFLKGVE